MAIREILGTSGGLDERKLTEVVIPYLADTLEDCLLPVQPPLGLRETGRTWRHEEAGLYAVDITFEGTSRAGNTSSPSDDEITYEARSTFREEPIEAHPQIQKLLKDFNGNLDTATGKITFPATLSGTSGTNALAGENGVAEEKPNPMAGVEKYMSLDIVWSKKYVSRSKPSFAMVGRVISRPPGGAPSIPKRDAWLVMPPNYTRRGNVYDIQEEWQLLPEGTPKEVYNLGSDVQGATPPPSGL